VIDVLAEKTRRAVTEAGDVTALAVAGGVAANQGIRDALQRVTNLPFLAPPMALCTDNAAMIAFAGGELLTLGKTSDMTLGARPRWPLDQDAPPMLAGGKRGAKA
jgi:N6-L-threonylcarbamoyladenine synthase